MSWIVFGASKDSLIFTWQVRTSAFLTVPSLLALTTVYVLGSYTQRNTTAVVALDRISLPSLACLTLMMWENVSILRYIACSQLVSLQTPIRAVGQRAERLRVLHLQSVSLLAVLVLCSQPSAVWCKWGDEMQVALLGDSDLVPSVSRGAWLRLRGGPSHVFRHDQQHHWQNALPSKRWVFFGKAQETWGQAVHYPVRGRSQPRHQSGKHSKRCFTGGSHQDSSIPLWLGNWCYIAWSPTLAVCVYNAWPRIRLSCPF